jgi:hypothetical protein
MTLVIALVVTGAFAQVADGDYSEYDANTTAPTNVDFVTVGSTMGYYAEPDPVYHPLYDAGNGWTLDAGGSWTWTIPTNPGVATMATPGAANYVEITWVGTGNHVVNVAESFTGGCTDLTPTVMNTTVLPVPTAALTGAAVDANWDEITASQEYQRCSALPAGENLTATFTETGVLAANAHYAYGIQLTRTAYDALGAVVDGPTVSTLIDYPTTAKADGATNDGGSMNTNSGALSYYNDGTDDYRTVYVFTLIKASDAPGAAADGVISQISEKSDYLAAAVNTYAFSGSDVTYNINLPPVTGPVYYIANDFYN